MRHSDNYMPGTEKYRIERFAELRAFYSDADHDEILEMIYEGEIDAASAIEERRIMAEMDA